MMVWLLYLMVIGPSNTAVVTTEAVYADARECWHMARAMTYGTQRAACAEGVQL